MVARRNPVPRTPGGIYTTVTQPGHPIMATNPRKDAHKKKTTPKIKLPKSGLGSYIPGGAVNPTRKDLGNPAGGNGEGIGPDQIEVGGGQVLPGGGVPRGSVQEANLGYSWNGWQGSMSDNKAYGLIVAGVLAVAGLTYLVVI